MIAFFIIIISKLKYMRKQELYLVDTRQTHKGNYKHLKDCI